MGAEFKPHFASKEEFLSYLDSVNSSGERITYNDEVTEEDYKAFIDGLENEVVDWEKVKKSRKLNCKNMK